MFFEAKAFLECKLFYYPPVPNGLAYDLAEDHAATATTTAALLVAAVSKALAALKILKSKALPGGPAPGRRHSIENLETHLSAICLARCSSADCIARLMPATHRKTVLLAGSCIAGWIVWETVLLAGSDL